ncbi:hypothetical protein [Vitiosangium sp. GDMCC 1.1324]|uniref:hypothetical protein n=1 Tax=Vitiosangium sp. (strain GDMCC 1.1324) TaxID=2138576 RepID=UPI00130D6132|nr:hypothetical protein [Vitiosangium sp. GDMCC 1.1324]
MLPAIRKPSEALSLRGPLSRSGPTIAVTRHLRPPSLAASNSPEAVISTSIVVGFPSIREGLSRSTSGTGSAASTCWSNSPSNPRRIGGGRKALAAYASSGRCVSSSEAMKSESSPSAVAGRTHGTIYAGHHLKGREQK